MWWVASRLWYCPGGSLWRRRKLFRGSACLDATLATWSTAKRRILYVFPHQCVLSCEIAHGWAGSEQRHSHRWGQYMLSWEASEVLMNSDSVPSYPATQFGFCRLPPQDGTGAWKGVAAPVFKGAVDRFLNDVGQRSTECIFVVLPSWKNTSQPSQWRAFSYLPTVAPPDFVSKEVFKQKPKKTFVTCLQWTCMLHCSLQFTYERSLYQAESFETRFNFFS